MNRIVIVVALAALVGCPDSGKKGGASAQVDPYANDDPEPKPFENWYPDDIAPPEGTSYPCPLAEHPLPKELPGIPNKDQAFINHVYSQILACTQAKLLMYKALGRPGDAAALETFTTATAGALTKIKAEPVPEGLDAFRDEVVEAIGLIQIFFTKAQEQLGSKHTPASWKEAHTITEGRQASQKLLSAWGIMQRRYGKKWTPEMNKAIYHHLCALDLF